MESTQSDKDQNASILAELSDSVANLEIQKCTSLTQKAIGLGLPPDIILNEGLSKGMKVAGDRFGCREYALSELIVAAMCLSEALKLLQPLLEKSVSRSQLQGKVVIGTIEGDIHDIGKNIVVAMMTASGFEVHDLGVDVPPSRFVEVAKETGADVVASSTFLTTTRRYQRELEDLLRQNELRNKVVTMIGGVSTSPEWADEIGADAWAATAMEAVEKAKWLLQRKKLMQPT